MSGTTDTNWLSWVGERGLTIGRDTPLPIQPLQFDDILKFSHCDDMTIQDFTGEGGREDFIDAVRGSNYTIRRCRIRPNSNGITIKGSIDGWNVEDTVIAPFGTQQIDVGQFDNYWRPGRAPTRNGFITRCSTGTQALMRVRLWDATVPVVRDSNVQIIRIPKAIWFPYFVTQFFWVRIKGLKTS